MDKRKIGFQKEDEAVNYLVANDYSIVVRNFYSRHGEIDIIAIDGKCICFIEVKFRKNQGSGLPEEAVNKVKINKIIKVASFFLYSHQEYKDYQIRFDVISILGNEIRLYKNAFGYDGYY